MNRERLKQRIMKVRGWAVLDFSEAQAKRAIIEPIFDSLTWDTSDPKEVILEHALSPEGRVDYAFLKRDDPVILVEAKAPNKSLDSYSPQLLKYAFAKGVELAVLTNGVEWWLYLPMEGGEWDERKFYSIDLEKQDVEEVCDKLIEFLDKENVFSGKALHNAKEMRKSTHRKTKIRQTLPEIWKAIITEPNHALVDLLIEETERACGYKPDESTVKSFVAKISISPPPLHPPPLPPPHPPGKNKAWYYWEDRNGSGHILAFVNRRESCSMRRFDADGGTFLVKDPYKKGNYQENFAEYIRQEQLLHLSKQPNLGHARKVGRLPDWVLSEVRPQIRTILESEQNR